MRPLAPVLSVLRAGRRTPGRGVSRRRSQRTWATLASGAMVAGAMVPATAQETPTASDLRIGVLAVADAIAAMGRTPELAEPLPFTRTSAASVLRLDDVVTADLTTALTGTDLKTALDAVPGIEAVEDEGDGRLSFAYSQTVTVPLELAHDDGDLRFGLGAAVPGLTVALATSGERFEVEVDAAQPDELLRFALVSEPELELTVAIDGAVAPFAARQGFTEIDVTGGSYDIDRAADITLRDPDGRGLLTLEDLRYSNLVDLYRVTRTTDDVDISFDVALPGTVAIAGTDTAALRTGTLELDDSVAGDAVWPDPADATQSYGEALAAVTGLTLVDGVTALAEYTGTALVLQDAADVDFPNLGGSVTDLFAPADELLDLLATSAVAEIRCGLTPENPPSGNPAPGDAVYCQAVTATGLPAVTAATWSVADGGSVATTDPTAQLAAAGGAPAGTVQVADSDGQPDVVVDLTFADGTTMTARSLPRTIQDVTARISALGEERLTGDSLATVNLDADRLDVGVDLSAAAASAELPVGDPATLGALVGLTGLDAGPASKATARATDASFDVGFGIPFRDEPEPEPGAPLEEPELRPIELLPVDATLFEVDTITADAPTGLTGLEGRIGFLGVSVDIDELTLGSDDAAAAVVALSSLSAAGTDPILLDDLLSDEGTLAAEKVALVSRLTASIGFTATEEEISAREYATVDGPASGAARVVWDTSGLPRAEFGDGYEDLRVFDPVPATFLSGEAVVDDTPTVDYVDENGVTQTAPAHTVDVDVDVPAGDSLFAQLRVPSTDGVEVARRLVAPGVSCQNVTVVDRDTLGCEGLAPDGTAAFADGDTVEVIVLGDPFALRDGIIDGLAGSLNEFQRLDSDHVDVGEAGDLVDDQYTSTLPLVDLVPEQLAAERDAIADGLADVVTAATDDENGTPGTHPVSSAQELAAAVTALFGADSTLEYEVISSPTVPAPAELAGPSHLGVVITAQDTASLLAPLRFPVPGTGQVVSDGNVTVDVTSSTTVATIVDVASARPGASDKAASTSTATLTPTSQLERTLRAGVGELIVTGGSTDVPATSTASLDVTVATSRATVTDPLATVRSGAGASAQLDVDERDDHLVYAAAATDSSGGTGAEQPAPEPMKAKFLAEGLDGLATALTGALDGASPRVTQGGAPVAAPLIGSDLDAGAEVGEVLTGLTRLLRDELEAEAVVDAATADDLQAAVEAAVTAALADDSDTVSGTTPVVTVECEDCVPCAADDPDDCVDADDPTLWGSVTVTTVLTGDERVGETEFSVGLAGLNVRSDQPVATTTSWTLPVTLELVRGVGPQVAIGEHAALELDVTAALPGPDDVSDALGQDATAATCTADHAGCMPAILGYLPGMLTTATATPEAGSMATTITVDLSPDGAADYDLFELFDGIPTGTGFADPDGHTEDGLSLDFETVASEYGSFDLVGTINAPWAAATGFGDVTYEDVALDVGEVIATLATPFDVVDPYLGPARDVIDVLRTPIPVVSDISELGGGDEISLLSLVESFGGSDPRLDLAIRVTAFIETAVEVVGAVAVFAQTTVPMEDLTAAGELLTVEPSEIELAGSCTETVRTSTTTAGGGTGGTGATAPPAKKAKPQPCPDEPTEPGARKQSTAEKRRGTRTTNTSVATKTKSITGSAPGFSLPFLSDPDQIVDVLTGEGEASYFRIDFGTLAAEIAYTQKFGPIMAGPVPIVPFIGGSIGIEGRLAVGFDSMPQTLAVRSVAAGDVEGLITKLDGFDAGDIIREGFYLDDLDADGVDVPEVKLVTTLEAGAGVSIGIVTAGLKGGVTLSINLDLNDPNGDGRIRTAEIRDRFAGDPGCLFDVSATLEAFLQIFVEIELLITTKSFVFDILRLGPYTLFEYGCPTVTPRLVVAEGGSLALTSGSRQASRNASSYDDIPENYEVRQFDTGGGAAAGGTTTYEVDAISRVQRVVVAPTPADAPAVVADSAFVATIYESGVALSTTVQSRVGLADLDALAALRFVADGNDGEDDEFSFLLGETFADDGTLLSTPFTTPVTLHGHGGDDILATGHGDDIVTGGGGIDTITTGLGDDDIDAGPDADIVDAGAGQDDVDGGGGADRLQGGPGPDRIAGGAGDDALIGGPGRDVRALLISSDSHSLAEQVELGFDTGDVLVGGAGADLVDGGDGSDVVVGGDASALTTAEFGTLMGTGTRLVNELNEIDRVITEDVVVAIRTAVVPGPSELDSLCVSGTAVGGAGGGDLVTGGPESDVVVGGNGSDDLDGGGGADEICGRAGDDNISGDGGAPARDAGDDIIRGGHGHDLIDAGPGDDAAYGDDVDLYRGTTRVVDGTLAGTGSGDGDDYVVGADGDDVIAGGSGSDLLRGGVGDDLVHGEAADTTEAGGDAPGLEDRLVACNPTTRVVAGLVDLDGDLLSGAPAAGAPTAGVRSDDGRLAGLSVVEGAVLALGTTTPFTGLIGGETVLLAGKVDLDRSGVIDTDDTGTVPLASMLGTDPTTNPDGDCILGEDGDDDLRGGTGSDHVDAGAGLDLVAGGDGNDLLIGGGGTDVITGGPHHDVLVGGDGDDHMVGGDGDDRLRGNEGDDVLVGGTGVGGTTDGQDVLLGGRGEDVLAGENATVVSDAIVDEVDAAPWNAQAIVPAAATAGTDSDLRHDDGAVTCGPGSPDRWVTLLAGADQERTSVASPGGPELYDELFGGYDCDWVFGQGGDDLVRGGQDDDVVEGGPGDDTGHGDAGDDVVIGGSSVDQDVDGTIVVDRSGAGVADGDDTLLGDGGPDGEVGDDLVIGDNGTPTIVHLGVVATVAAFLSGEPTDATVTIALADVPMVGEPAVTTVFGDDVVDAGGGDDRVLGQSGDDDISGGEGQDILEGNAGQDDIRGQQDPDVVIGGSQLAGVHDDGDRLRGGGASDLVLGDNASVTGEGAPVDRDVVLHDVPGLDADGLAAPGGDTAGDDRIWGDDESGDTGPAAADRVYGQADDDVVHGQGGDDDLQGNAGDDTMFGEDGQDRVVGGSATDQSGTDGATHVFSGVADGDDDLAGGGGTDWLAGDNAVISTDGVITQADVRVLAEAALGTGVAGDDLIHGDAAPEGSGDLSTELGDVDVVRGQSGHDTIHGQDGNDDIEGNAGADTIHGDDGDDDIVGGSRRAGVDDAEFEGQGDSISGGTGTDWIVGDNALLSRHADGAVELLDVPVAGATSQPDPGTAGGDLIHGDGLAVDADGAADVIHGQSGDDTIHGQAGDDVIEGNAGSDTILGGQGDDALVGGSSADDGTAGLVAGTDADVPDLGPGAGRRLLAGVFDATGDQISGGPGVDVVLGDNGVVADHGTAATWRLHDVDVAGQEASHAHADVGAADVLSGDAGTDVVLGQAGDDRISGGADDDSLHGGPGADVAQGDEGADDLVGGSSHHWVGADLVRLVTVVDGADVLFGGAPTGACDAGLPGTGACDATTTDVAGDLGDTIIGDNGHVTRGDQSDARLVGAAVDGATGDPIRSVMLYDVDVVDVATFPAAASGIDTVFGAAGRDRIFGQADGDVLFGQAGDDEVEGNGGADTIDGGVGSDDLIGGSSSDAAGLVQAGGFPDVGTDVADGDDRLVAGDGDDVALGDNGIILRPVGAWTHHAAPYGHVRRSTVEVAFAFEKVGAFGNDLIDAGTGHDDVRGQLGDDTLEGGAGDDTLIGDLGHLLEHGVIAAGDPRTRSVSIPADALDEPVFRVGSLYREVELFETIDPRDPEVSTSQGTGADTITGGGGNDAIHAGSGDDIVNGHGDIVDDGVPGSGPDRDAVRELDARCGADPDRLVCDEDDVFAGHGNDQVWGGPGHDRLFGGHNADDLDVIRAAPATPAMFRNPDVDFVGVDLIFGGWGQDSLQADQSVNGPDAGDRLIDSAGAYNAFFVCNGGLGDSTAMRRLSPANIAFLEDVGIAAGAYAAASSGTSGWWSLATIYNRDVRSNSSPTHPEHPGNFVCVTPEEPVAPEPTAPVAAFTWDCTDLACTFTDESTSATAITGWVWDFGDDTTSTDQDPGHTFAASGLHVVELTVTDEAGTDAVTHEVVVEVAGEPSGELVLIATGQKVKGKHVVELGWDDPTLDVVILRDGVQLDGVTGTGGSHVDAVGGRGSATYRYQVCDAAATATCSNEVTVVF